MGYQSGELSPKSASAAPSIRDPNLKVQVVAKGLSFPTTMDFLGPNDILVLEKNNGTVQRIQNGTMLLDPVLDVNVANKYERGMLGIAILSKEEQQQENGTTYIFLYYTEADVEGSDICPTSRLCESELKQLSNHLYRYEFVNNKLVNPKLLMELPASPIPAHNGGKILIGPDKNVYFTIGDLNYRTSTQNFPKSLASNGTSAIYRVTSDGRSVQPVLSNEHPLDKYYAYGIRNSFGIDFDPVTSKLWDTENGPAFGDEINLVEPGFNSGWRKVQGVWDVQKTSAPEGRVNSTDLDNKVILNPVNLEDFGGKGNYSSPEFTWFNSTAPTAIVFLDSDKLGKQYRNDIFVGNYKQGQIYHFKLNQNRTGLDLDGPLLDKVANLPAELEGVKLGEGFGAITDIQVGPYDGYLYIVSHGRHGEIYRIVPASVP
jgi:aldose sugar dehydrogenase